jgi:hypothetical protein
MNRDINPSEASLKASKRDYLPAIQMPQSSAGLPLRVILTSSALFQVYTYVVVVLYSLCFGGIDLAIPVKSAFFSTIVILLILAVDDLRTDWRNRSTDISRFGKSLYRLACEIATSIGLIVLGYLFLLQPFSNVDLRNSLSLEVRAVASIGVLSLLAFTGVVIVDVYGLKRKGELPLVGKSD